ncbi:hypothetical protein PSAC2689_40355 [Paraburkholderia sacchari]
MFVNVCCRFFVTIRHVFVIDSDFESIAHAIRRANVLNRVPIAVCREITDATRIRARV